MTTPIGHGCAACTSCPAGGPNCLRASGNFGPDAVVLDLEDSVPPADKEPRAEAAFAALQRGAARRSPLVLVRINPSGSPWHGADAVAAGTDRAGQHRRVVLPEVRGHRATRAAAPGAAAGCADRRRAGERPRHRRRAGAARRGARRRVLRQPRTSRADIGARRTPGGIEVLYARSEVVLACRLLGVVAAGPGRRRGAGRRGVPGRRDAGPRPRLSRQDLPAPESGRARERDLHPRPRRRSRTPARCCTPPRTASAWWTGRWSTRRTCAMARRVLALAGARGTGMKFGVMITIETELADVVPLARRAEELGLRLPRRSASTSSSTPR